MIDFERLDGVIFDLDGTLVDSMWVWEQIDIEFLGKRGFEVPEDYLETITPMGYEVCADYTIKRFGLKETREEIIQEWFSMAIDAYANDVVLKPGALDFIRYLHGRGIKMSVATASDMELVIPVLTHNEVLHYFDNITTVREAKRGKGFPDVYHLSADKMNTRRTKCAVFEDIIEGLRGAKMGGYLTVGVYDERSKKSVEELSQSCDMFIYDFKECMSA